MKKKKTNMNKFKVGDKVRIKEDLKVGCEYNDGCRFVLDMEKYKGKTAVIKNGHIHVYLNDTVENANNYRYELDIDNGYWWWSSSMLEKVEDKKHFKSLPRDFTGTIDVEKGFITNIAKKEILDEVEKEYLGAVIRPFKERIMHIALNEGINRDNVYVYIELNDSESIYLPYFKKGTMYKNMKIWKKYTLEELGLD